MVLTDNPVAIQKRTDDVGEIEAALPETVFALGILPLEFYGRM